MAEKVTSMEYVVCVFINDGVEVARALELRRVHLRADGSRFIVVEGRQREVNSQNIYVQSSPALENTSIKSLVLGGEVGIIR